MQGISFSAKLDNERKRSIASLGNLHVSESGVPTVFLSSSFSD